MHSAGIAHDCRLNVCQGRLRRLVRLFADSVLRCACYRVATMMMPAIACTGKGEQLVSCIG